MYVSAAHACSAQGNQKRTVDPLELEFQPVVCAAMRVLGMEPGRSSQGP